MQVNEDELAQLATDADDPWAWARGSVGQGVKEMIVTMGGEGAARVGPVEPGGDEDVAVLRVPTSDSGGGDPTGCGDVWGATFFGGRLAGVPLTSAMERANRVAGINLRTRGATRFRAAAEAARESLR